MPYVYSTKNKTVLVLIGNMNNPKIEEQYWNHMFATQPNIQVKYQNMAEFEEKRPPNDTHYDCVIISGHGNFADKGIQASGKQHRKAHIIGISPDKTIKTVELIETCSTYTDKILISSCHAGAVAKDLHSTPVKAEVVTLGGSKYPTISYSSAALEIAKKFVTSGVARLYEFTVETFPNSIAIQDKDRNITKLGAVKIIPTESESVKSAVRHVYKTRPMHEAKLTMSLKEDSWWVQDKIFPVGNSQEFKDAALCVAVDKRKVNDVIYWINVGARPNTELNTHGNTPLYHAVYLKDDNLVGILLDNGADPNLHNHSGLTPLSKAVFDTSIATTNELLKVKDGRIKTNPDLPDGLGYTPLIFAVKSGSYALVEVLLTSGANPNLPDKSGNTPFFIATQKGDNRIIELLRSKLTPEQIAANKTTAAVNPRTTQGLTRLELWNILSGYKTSGFFGSKEIDNLRRIAAIAPDKPLQNMQHVTREEIRAVLTGHRLMLFNGIDIPDKTNTDKIIVVIREAFNKAIRAHH